MVTRRSLVAHHAEIVFVYGIKNKLTQFMDAGAPAVYRDVKREDLLAICDTHGMLYAWVSCYKAAALSAKEPSDSRV